MVLRRLIQVDMDMEMSVVHNLIDMHSNVSAGPVSTGQIEETVLWDEYSVEAN